MKKLVRIFLSDDAVLELPVERVAMSLYNDLTIPSDGSPKTIAVDEAWANGDGVEIVVRRVPKK